jgi:ribokinase
MTGNVLTVGSLMMDVIAYVSRNPRIGETLRGDDLEIVPGGKGFNQAIAVQRAGSRSTMVGCMGRDAFGDEFARFLARERVDAVGVERSDAIGTGVGLPVVSQDGQNAIIITPRANDLVDAAFIERQRAQFTGQDIVLLQLELPLDGALAAARLAKGLGQLVVLTPAPVQDISAFAGLVDYLVPNESELASLVPGIPGREGQAQELLRTIGATAVVVTLGEEGAMIVTADSLHLVPAPHVAAVNTVGAGDIFCGNLAAKLAQGTGLLAAVQWAVAAASLSVTRRGSADSAPNAAEVEHFLAHGAGDTVPSVV